MTHRYYGLIQDGRKIAEVLVTRRDGRQVSQEPTGVTYRTQREAMADNERKNRVAS